DLAEHLADLGRGGEIAGGADGLARRIVAGKAERHVALHRHRPVPSYPRGEGGEKIVGHRPRERQTSHSPISAMGTDSSMPIVRPPARKPICGSGSRTVSTRMRAAA